MASEAEQTPMRVQQSWMVFGVLCVLALGSAYMTWQALGFEHPAQIYPGIVWSGLTVLLVATGVRHHTGHRAHRGPGSATPPGGSMGEETQPAGGASTGEAAEPARDRTRVRKAAFIAIWAIYPLALTLIGYVIATVVTLAVSVRVLMRVPLVLLLPVCAVFAAVSFLVLRVYVHVLFPEAAVEAWLLDLWYSR